MEIFEFRGMDCGEVMYKMSKMTMRQVNDEIKRVTEIVNTTKSPMMKRDQTIYLHRLYQKRQKFAKKGGC